MLSVTRELLRPSEEGKRQPHGEALKVLRRKWKDCFFLFFAGAVPFGSTRGRLHRAQNWN